MNAITVVEDEVRELVRRLVDEVIAEYGDRSLTGSLPQLVGLRLAAAGCSTRVAGFGPPR